MLTSKVLFFSQEVLLSLTRFAINYGLRIAVLCTALYSSDGHVTARGIVHTSSRKPHVSIIKNYVPQVYIEGENRYRHNLSKSRQKHMFC